MMIKPNCPLCGQMVLLPKRRKKDVEYDAEYIQTRRGTKQLFHSSCYHKMIQNKGNWYQAN